MSPLFNIFSFCWVQTISVLYCAHLGMKCSLSISNFLEEISCLSHSIVFLYLFALISEEGFLISPCYSLELCIRMDTSFVYSFAFCFYILVRSVLIWDFPGRLVVKILPAMQETWVQFLGQEDPWRRAWHTTPVFLPGEPRGVLGMSPLGIEGPGRMQSIGLQRVTHD